MKRMVRMMKMMKMRFLFVDELQRFLLLSRVHSQPRLGPGGCWIRTFSSSSSPGAAGPGQDPDPLQDPSVGLAQRFKRTFQQYGKVLVPVHLLTSCMWFGGFYYAALKGVNPLPFLEHVGLPEKFVKLLENSQSGYALTAYAMYKIATPARYTLTLGGTSLSVKYLRRHGYMSTPPPVKEYLQEKMEETRDRFSEKLQETKDKVRLRKKSE